MKFFTATMAMAMAIFMFFGTGAALAFPVDIGNDQKFISADEVAAMGGDINAPMHWTGDKNKWGLTEVTVSEHNGQKGVIVTGTGSRYYRWNLIQKNYDRKYLRIEAAYPGYQFEDAVYKPGDLIPADAAVVPMPKDRDYQGTGISFW